MHFLAKFPITKGLQCVNYVIFSVKKMMTRRFYAFLKGLSYNSYQDRRYKHHWKLGLLLHTIPTAIQLALTIIMSSNQHITHSHLSHIVYSSYSSMDFTRDSTLIEQHRICVNDSRT